MPTVDPYAPGGPMYNPNVAHPSTTPDAKSAPEPSAPVDPSTLNELDKQYYDVWHEQNPTAPLTTDVLQSFGYYQDALDDPTNVNAYRALIDTSLVKPMTYTDPETGKVLNYRVVTPEAIDMMGGTFALSGSGKNDVYLLPGGTKGVHNSTFYSQDITEGAYAGMTQVVSTGNPNSGFSLVGNILGQDAEDFVAKTIPDEVKFAMDPLGISGSLVYGTEFNHAGTKSFAKRTGLKYEEVATAQAVGKVIVQSVLLATPLAPVAAGIEAAAQANMVAQGQKKWGEALASTALYAAKTIVVGNPYAGAALQAGYDAVQGEDAGKIFENLAWEAAGVFAGSGNQYGSIAVSALRTQVDPSYSNVQFVASVGRSLAGQQVRGGIKKPSATWNTDSMWNAFGQDIISTQYVPDSWLPSDKAPMDDLHGYPAAPRPGPSGAARRPPPTAPKGQTFEDLLVGFAPEAYYKPKYV